MADVRYVENPAGIRGMLAAPFMVDAMRQVAERGKAGAERNTPFDTGRMKASWKVAAGVRNGAAWAQIYNTATNPQTGFHYPWALENGTRYIKRRRILGRAIDDMAMRP